MSDDAEATDTRPTAGGPKGDRRWLPSLTVLVLIAIPVLLPLPRARPLGWILPGIAVPLLIAVVAVDPGRVDQRSSVVRTLSVTLTLVLVVGALAATGLLVDELLRGAPDLRSANTLLWVGFLVWIDANLTFALLYWELDSGGPAQRLHSPPLQPDLAFPQHMNPSIARPGWLPLFPDYLYLGVTNALAFSPTDVMPLTHWAKLVMGLQSLMSLGILSLVIANAVNLLG
jgi:hypothetical protein